MRRKRILITLAVGAMCISPTHVFADDTVKMPVIKVTMSQAPYKDMEYCTGSFELTDVDGNVTTSYAKFKTRGATAQKYMMKPALNMKFYADSACTIKKDMSLLGIREDGKYLLDAMAIDRICMRNRIGMDIWNEFAKLPYKTDYDSRSGTVGQFVELYLNGVYKGIYCMSDEINRKLLGLKKYKNGIQGILYKSGTNDISKQEDPCFTDDYIAAVISYHNAWEIKYPDDYVDGHADATVWEPLQDLYSNHKNYADVKKYFYLENIADYELHVLAMCLGDNFGNKNHFFSIRNSANDIDDSDAEKAAMRKVIISPWDLDTSLGGSSVGNYYGGTYSTWSVKDAVKNGGCYPLSSVQGNAEFKNILKSRWAEVRMTAFAPENVNKRLDAYRDLFINSGAWKRMVDYWNSLSSSKPKYVDDLDQELTYIKEWYADRVAQMDSYFGIDAAGIDNVNADYKNVTDDNENNKIYNMQGQRLNEIPQKGIFIMNGRKYCK